MVNRIDRLIGNTPMVQLVQFAEKMGAKADIFAKLESKNPGGSVKDRAALYMINEAEATGKLKPGGTIVEPTSGNTGIGLAMIATARGYRTILTMPDTMSAERISVLKAYGAEIELTPGAMGMAGAIKAAEEIVMITPGAVMMGQFDNEANVTSHVMTTAPEIYVQMEERVDAFIAGIGSGGTVTGVGKGFELLGCKADVIGVEPAESPYLTRGRSGVHGIQGIGAGFAPSILDRRYVKEVVTVTTDDAKNTMKTLAQTEAILCGISGGAALKAAVELSHRPEYMGKRLVVLLPDSGERYLSMGIY
ncbi:MAG: cysteine synthase A [Clostridiales bacterium]|nr:cysteine synthase A [Clostridiales bacterium]